MARGPVQAAVDRCDSVIGKNNYCVIRIVATSKFPVTITRSKTKLVSHPGTVLKDNVGAKDWIIIKNHNKTPLEQIVIDGLIMTGSDAGNGEVTAISVNGKNIRKVAIANNTISHFQSTQNAHAIAIYGRGTKPEEAISQVSIDSNTVHHMKTGSSESIVVNGNVFRWTISNNNLQNINNIAIDAIGGEGTSPPETVNGRIYPGKFDQARYGFIENNTVRGMSIQNNPAYSGSDSWVAAIYIDGGAHINIKNNLVENSDWGFEVGAENCVHTRHITLTGNTVNKSSHGDFLLGGWNTQGYREPQSQINCNPNRTHDSSEGHGYVSHVTATNNHFNSSPAHLKIANILAQYRVWNSTIEDSKFHSINADSADGKASGDNNAIRDKKREVNKF